jgi:hypothetical protein
MPHGRHGSPGKPRSSLTKTFRAGRSCAISRRACGRSGRFTPGRAGCAGPGRVETACPDRRCGRRPVLFRLRPYRLWRGAAWRGAVAEFFFRGRDRRPYQHPILEAWRENPLRDPARQGVLSWRGPDKQKHSIAPEEPRRMQVMAHRWADEERRKHDNWRSSHPRQSAPKPLFQTMIRSGPFPATPFWQAGPASPLPLPWRRRGGTC